MIIGIPVYEGVDLLDVAGPYEMFRWIPESEGVLTVIISADGAPATTMNGLRFEAHHSFANAPTLDVLWVPGGAPEALAREMTATPPVYLDYIRHVAETATWVCSVCEGAMLLAQAGLLDGHKATTHWAFVNCLNQFPKIEVDTTNARYIQSGNRLTGGGISSGLDEALYLISLITNEAVATGVQVSTQYFPEPPFKGAIPPAPPCPFTW